MGDDSQGTWRHYAVVSPPGATGEVRVKREGDIASFVFQLRGDHGLPAGVVSGAVSGEAVQLPGATATFASGGEELSVTLTAGGSKRTLLFRAQPG